MQTTDELAAYFDRTPHSVTFDGDRSIKRDGEFRADHRAQCAWCDELATGTALFENVTRRFASCSAEHGTEFRAFP